MTLHVRYTFWYIFFFFCRSVHTDYSVKRPNSIRIEDGRRFSKDSAGYS